MSERQPARRQITTAREVPAQSLEALAIKCYEKCNSFDRGAPWLTWRYDRHPDFKYRAFIVASGETDGDIGVVVREDETAGFKFLHVVDVIGDPANAPLAAQFVENLGRDSGCDFIDVTATNTAIAGAFRAAAWFSINDDAWAQLSHLFYPPQWRQPATSSTGLWSRAMPPAAYDVGRLHIVKGDMDLDRPTMEYYEQHDLHRA